MNKKAVTIAIICLLVCSLIAGWLYFSLNVQNDINSNEVKNIELDFDNILSNMALIDGSLIYFGVDGTVAKYYRHYIDDNKTVLVGTIDNFYLSGRGTAIIDDKLYFYACVILNTHETSNDLFCIDLSDNTLKKYEKDDESLGGIPTLEFNKKVLTLKNEVSGDIITTFIDEFDVESKTWNKQIINTYQKSNNLGSAIYSVYGNDEALYVLYDECLGGNGNTIKKLKIYDKDMKEVRSLDIDRTKFGDVFRFRIMEMAVFGDYIYIYNVSNYAVLGKIGETSITPIIFERDLEVAPGQIDSMNPLFFVRYTNKCYSLEAETGEITQIDAQIGNDYSIMYMLSDMNDIAVLFYADDKPYYMYYLERARLNNTYLPCKS
jgi:hypothetical protein